MDNEQNKITENKGNCPSPGPGRPKGSVNKFTNLKNSFLEVYEDIGGTEGLKTWVNENKLNKRLFYQWITRLLPATQEHEGEVNLNLRIERIITDKRPDE